MFLWPAFRWVALARQQRRERGQAEEIRVTAEMNGSVCLLWRLSENSNIHQLLQSPAISNHHIVYHKYIKHLLMSPQFFKNQREHSLCDAVGW